MFYLYFESKLKFWNLDEIFKCLYLKIIVKLCSDDLIDLCSVYQSAQRKQWNCLRWVQLIIFFWFKNQNTKLIWISFVVYIAVIILFLWELRIRIEDSKKLQICDFCWNFRWLSFVLIIYWLDFCCFKLSSLKIHLNDSLFIL